MAMKLAQGSRRPQQPRAPCIKAKTFYMVMVVGEEETARGRPPHLPPPLDMGGGPSGPDAVVVSDGGPCHSACAIPASDEAPMTCRLAQKRTPRSSIRRPLPRVLGGARPPSSCRHLSHCSMSAIACTFVEMTQRLGQVQANAAGVHSEDAPTCSNMITEYDDFTWKTSFVRPMQSEVVNALRRGDRQRASLILSNFHHTKEALTKEDFSYILEYCAEAPDPLFVMETLELMEEKAIGMSKSIYRYVIRALSRGGYEKEALHWLALLGEKESTHATIPIFNIFLNACGSRENLKDAECCLEILENLFLGKSEITYCELLKLRLLVCFVFLACSVTGNLPATYDIWKDCCRSHPAIMSREAGYWLNIWLMLSLSYLRRKLGQFNNCQLAEHLFTEMQKIGLQPSNFTYDGFVKTVIAGKGIAYANKVIKAMERRGIGLYSDTLAALSVGHSNSSQLDLAEELLERISEIKPKHLHAFNALLSGCAIMPTLRTYELLFSLFGNVNVPYEEGNVLSHVDVSKRISIIEMDMFNNGIQHSFVSMKNLIRAFGSEGMIEEMLRYLNIAENILWNINPYQKSDLYSIALHALVDAKETHRAVIIFKIMRSCSLPTNISIYNTMIECCKWLPCFRSASALLSLMLRDGFNPKVVTFTSLLKVVLANNNFEGTLDLLDICKIEGLQPDIQIFNTVLSRAYARGQIHVLEYIVECIHRAKIQPDPSTLWYTFCAYEEHELYNTAIAALLVLSMRMISEDVSILSEKRIVFEDLILSEEPDAELRIIRAFQAGEEFLATALLNLRWCATMGATISWSPEESLWARRLASSYDANKGPHINPSDVPKSW
ncbi:unnamed protein product [Miscanthus lutarioriparius]|uniref:Pentatricopeptide repeat-containing protein n=1 Tax=Miscanthus lutarioriparius TaxID=422564 RepID=A0A811NPT1_9POAL|nr:unnamed protein product [Miscanthus lutarioriparius]